VILRPRPHDLGVHPMRAPGPLGPLRDACETARGARPSRLLLAASSTLAAAFILAACGGSSSSPPKAAAATAADNALKFARCMREHGVKSFPDPEISGGTVRFELRQRAGKPGDVNRQTMEAAQRACRHFRAASRPNLTPQERVAAQEAVLKFAKCMREHGVDVHASTAGGGVQIGIRRGRGGGPNPESPAFQAAQKACQGLLPFRRGIGPGAPKQGVAGAAKTG
jgi:hypothetical protein